MQPSAKLLKLAHGPATRALSQVSFSFRPPASIEDIADKRKELAAQGLSIINLAMGNPGLTPESTVVQAMQESLSASYDYGPPNGFAETREAVAHFLNRAYSFTDTQPTFSAHNICVTNGATGAIASAQRLALKDGGKTLLTAPFYPSYKNAPKELANSGIEVVQAKAADGWQPPMNQLRDAFQRNERTNEQGKKETAIRSIILNYPNNPTGAVLSKEKSLELKTFLEEMMETYSNPIMVILDDAYLGVARTPSHSILQHPISQKLKDNTVVAISGAKNIGIPSARAGALATYNTQLLKEIEQANKSMHLMVSNTSQTGLTVGLNQFTQEKSQFIGQYYADKARYVTERLNTGTNNQTTQPEGGIFVFADLSVMVGRQIPEALRKDLGKDIIENETDISLYLMHMAQITPEQGGTGKGVAVVPGSSCGTKDMNGWVRLCVSSQKDIPAHNDQGLKDAMDVIDAALQLQLPTHLKKPGNDNQKTGGRSI